MPNTHAEEIHDRLYLIRQRVSACDQVNRDGEQIDPVHFNAIRRDIDVLEELNSRWTKPAPSPESLIAKEIPETTVQKVPVPEPGGRSDQPQTAAGSIVPQTSSPAPNQQNSLEPPA